MSFGGNDQKNLSGVEGLAQEIGKQHPFSHPEIELYLNLIRSAEHLSIQLDALFKDHGISQTQYNALRILRGHGVPVASGLVARQMVTRAPDITRLLDRLAKLGLIERNRSSDDRRVRLAQLTPEGEALLAQLDAPVLEMHKRQFEHMSRDEIVKANAIIARLRSASSES